MEADASVFRAAAAGVARTLSLPDDWINDGAKAYLVGLSLGEMLHQSTALEVRAASRIQLLAMKLAAWRDAIDRADAELLLSDLSGSRDEIWADVERFLPEPHRMKAWLAFQDLWETIHGRS